MSGPDDFPRLIQSVASFDPSQGASRLVRTLFAIRRTLGEAFGWDRPSSGVGWRVSTLRDRLPADLSNGPTGPQSAFGFTSLYLTDDEWAAEIANQTMHGILHIGRVPEPTGGFRTHMAIYVRPNGLLGNAYMAAIKPFRCLIVYPSILRQLGRTWHANPNAPSSQGDLK